MKDFLYGGQYYPSVEKRENWDKDLKLMKESGVTFVRTAELVNTWDSLEPSEGKYNFEPLKEFLDVCAKYEIKAVLGTGTNSPPYWLHKKDPEINILGMTGRRFPNNLVYGWACYNNPTFKHYAEQYIKSLVKTFRGHPAVAGYQINNEIGYPFMPLESGEIDVYCYCEHCKAEYRKWLREKYVTLEQLDHAYTWDSTMQIHESWDDVQPPFGKPTTWGPITRWIDWRLFHMSVIENEVKWESRMIKTLDTKHFVTANIFYMKSQDLMGTITAIDQFNIAKHIDVLGYDLYPGSGAKLERKPEFSAMFYDHAKSVSKFAGIKYGLAEAESGPIGGWVLGPETNTTEVDIERNQLQAIGHNAKYIMYQLYKEMPQSPIHWGGIINFDSTKTRRYDTVKKIGEFVHKENDFLMNANQEKALVGLLVTKENQIILNAFGHEKFFVEELRGTYSYYLNRGYAVEFLTEEQMKDGSCNQYKVIHAPLLAHLPEDLGSCVESYIKQGGRFVSSARLGYVGKFGWVEFHYPGGQLHQTSGFEVIEAESNVNPLIEYKGRKISGYWHKERIQIKEQNASVTASYLDDSEPAVVETNIGKGSFLYFGTHFGNAYLNGTGLEEILDDYLGKHDIKPLASIACDLDMKKTIQHSVIKTETRAMLIVTNYANKQQRKVLKDNKFETDITFRNKFVKSVMSVVSEKEIPFETTNEGIMFKADSSVDNFDIYDIRMER